MANFLIRTRRASIVSALQSLGLTAVLLGSASQVQAESWAEASWKVGFSVGTEAGLVVTSDGVAPSRLINQSSGNAGTYLDYFWGGDTEMVEWDTFAFADNPDGRAVAGFFGPLRAESIAQGPQPVPVLTISNPTANAAAMTLYLSSFEHMRVFTTLPSGYAGARISFGLYGGAPGAPNWLGGYSDTCTTHRGCTANYHNVRHYAPIVASIDPGARYEFWIRDTSAVSFAGAVPEPSAWVMMFAGFGLTGLLLRRRQAPARA